MTLAKPHFSFWIFAAVGLLWNLMGCLNYIMQANADVVAQMPELYQEIIAARPAWATAAFAIAVFGGAVGCILLLLRRRVASAAFVVSLIAIAGHSVFTLRVAGVTPSLVLVVLVGVALLWYSSIARRSGWLG
ncbi:hypothetical protein OA238_c26830 [Octadecabacter arcticus 238]|uniref:Integral membrane protein n=1 Tax=Octadecabacter arcticus 238 TaxID=391616 RepID=M9RQI3_9RHOB|nr:hypothetical protein [Octadecabacter arcticus]AGI72721.1 hypothetical protein OA238_c26830 [Octadecabacter arcticus 238]